MTDVPLMGMTIVAPESSDPDKAVVEFSPTGIIIVTWPRSDPSIV